MSFMVLFVYMCHNYCMSEILKTILGFLGILFVGLVGVAVSEVMKLGDMNTLIVTVDNVAHVR